MSRKPTIYLKYIEVSYKKITNVLTVTSCSILQGMITHKVYNTASEIHAIRLLCTCWSKENEPATVVELVFH